MKKILFRLLLRYLQKNGYEYTIRNEACTYVHTPNRKFHVDPTATLIIPASGEYLETKVPSTKLNIKPDAGHIGNVNDIVTNPKGKLHVSPKKVYLKKTKKSNSAGVGTTSPDIKIKKKI